MLIQPLAGYLADKVQIRTTVLIGLLIAALAIGAVTFTSGAVPFVNTVLAGVGVGTVWTNTDTLVSSLAEQNKLGAGMGAAQSFKEFGDMVGPLLVGVLTQLFGVRVDFVACSALALLCLAVLARSNAGRA